jgi:hypothetical protein
MFIEDDNGMEPQERSIGERLAEYERLTDPDEGMLDSAGDGSGPSSWPARRRSKQSDEMYVYEVYFIGDGRAYRETVKAPNASKAQGVIERRYPGVHVRYAERKKDIENN